MGTNWSGGMKPARRVLPADERLDADDPAGREVGLRLVVDDELADLDRPAQLAGERESGRVVRVLLRVVDGGAGVRVLRHVHGDVRVLDEGVDVGAVLREGSDADAGRRLEREPVQVEGLLERLVDAVGEHGRLDHASVGVQDRELVAAQAGDDAPAAHCVQPRAQLLQQQVAALVTECVVDLLEAVDVEQEDDGGPVLACGTLHALPRSASGRACGSAGLSGRRSALDARSRPSGGGCAA